MMRLARLYDLVHRGTAGDLEFYRERCRGADSVLELGCGTGRVLAALQDTTPHLVGLDLDPAKLEIAGGVAEKATLLTGDMADFDLGRRFDRVLVPYTGFFCLSPRQKKSCLGCVARHLTASGELWLDSYLVPEDEHHSPVEIEDFEHIATTMLDDEPVHVFERMRPCSVPSAFDATYRFETEFTSLSQTIRHFFLSQEGYEALFCGSELVVIARLESFDGTRLAKDSERIVLGAARPPGKAIAPHIRS